MTVLAGVPLTGAACWLAPVANADSGPAIIAYDVPTTVQADVPATFDVTLADDAATVGTIAWNFGDGSAGSTGADTSHAWTAPGTYLVTLTTVDTLGIALSQGFAVTVTPAPAPAAVSTPADTTPALTFAATQSRKRWTRKQGTAFTLTLNRRADVTMTFAKRRTGALATSSHPLGTLSANVLPGGQRIGFHGLLGAADSLAPGRYVVTMTAGAAGTGTAPVTLDFTVQRPKREKTHARGVRQRDQSG